MTKSKKNSKSKKRKGKTIPSPPPSPKIVDKDDDHEEESDDDDVSAVKRPTMAENPQMKALIAKLFNPFMYYLVNKFLFPSRKEREGMYDIEAMKVFQRRISILMCVFSLVFGIQSGNWKYMLPFAAQELILPYSAPETLANLFASAMFAHGFIWFTIAYFNPLCFTPMVESTYAMGVLVVYSLVWKFYQEIALQLALILLGIVATMPMFTSIHLFVFSMLRLALVVFLWHMVVIT